jgi:hypothetical protein
VVTSLELLPLVHVVRRLIPPLARPLCKFFGGLLAKLLPEVTVQAESAVDDPWTRYTATGVMAEAGPAGSQVRAAAAPTEAQTATERHTDLDLNMGSPDVV